MEIVLAILSSLLIIAVCLSFVKNDYWVFKILEYPRLQKIVVVALLLMAWLWVWPGELLYRIIFFAAGCSLCVPACQNMAVHHSCKKRNKAGSASKQGKRNKNFCSQCVAGKQATPKNAAPGKINGPAYCFFAGIRWCLGRRYERTGTKNIIELVKYQPMMRRKRAIETSSPPRVQQAPGFSKQFGYMAPCHIIQVAGYDAG